MSENNDSHYTDEQKTRFEKIMRRTQRLEERRAAMRKRVDDFGDAIVNAVKADARVTDVLFAEFTRLLDRLDRFETIFDTLCARASEREQQVVYYQMCVYRAAFPDVADIAMPYKAWTDVEYAFQVQEPDGSILWEYENSEPETHRYKTLAAARDFCWYHRKATEIWGCSGARSCWITYLKDEDGTCDILSDETILPKGDA